MPNDFRLMILLTAIATTSITAHAQETATPTTNPPQDLTIQVNRDKGQMGSLCATQLYVDGKLVAQVTKGGSVSFPAPAGSQELMARPALDSNLCKKFYATPQFEARISLQGASGPVAVYRYGFTGKGLPFIEPATP